MIRKKNDSGWWEGELQVKEYIFYFLLSFSLIISTTVLSITVIIASFQARGKKRQIGWFPATYVKPLTSSSNRSTPVSHGYQDSPTDPNIGNKNKF